MSINENVNQEQNIQNEINKTNSTNTATQNVKKILTSVLNQLYDEENEYEKITNKIDNSTQENTTQSACEDSHAQIASTITTILRMKSKQIDLRTYDYEQISLLYQTLYMLCDDLSKGEINKKEYKHNTIFVENLQLKDNNLQAKIEEISRKLHTSNMKRSEISKNIFKYCIEILEYAEEHFGVKTVNGYFDTTGEDEKFYLEDSLNGSVSI
ncbi:hypothetical protein BDAP_001910 [Binucleata daphniae]